MTQNLHHLAGAYALDALPDDERILFEAWVESSDEATKSEVAELLATASVLAFEAAETPPPGLRDSILKMADETRQLPPVVVSLDAARQQRRERRRPSWVAGVAAAAAAVALTAGASLTMFERIDTLQTDMTLATSSLDIVRAPDVRIVTSTQADGSTARVVFSSLQGEGVFLADDLAALGSSETYALWLIRDGQAEMAGLFGAADGTSTRNFAADLAGVTDVAVTVEPAGQAPTQPSTTPIVVVRIA